MGGGSFAWTIGRGVIGSPGADSGQPLYEFSQTTFTPGGQSGQDGPDIVTARNGAGNPSWATQYLNMPSQNGVMEWTVPETGSYKITAAGAGHTSGSTGATVAGDFSLTKGQVLKFVIGQQGLWQGGSGGSYVTTNTNIPLVIGGGSGSPVSFNQGSENSNANSETRGFDGGGGSSGSQGFGGNNGNGGSGANDFCQCGQGDSGGGGGLLSNGGPNNNGGKSFINGSRGGDTQSSTVGGFGGGGGAGSANGTGGGGGYSGGGAGGTGCCGSGSASGGGGSFIAANAENAENFGANNNGQGFITVTKVQETL